MTTKVAVVIFAALLAVVHATTTVTNPCAADTGIDNYNGQYGSTTYYILYRGFRIPLMKFDLSGIPADAYILSAKLNLTFDQVGTDWGGPLAIKLFQFTIQDVWTEFNEDATWVSSGITPWAAPGMKDGVDMNTMLSRHFNLDWLSSPNNWTTVEVREVLQKSIEAGRNWAGFMFTSYQYASNIMSRESATPPTITITWAQGVPRAVLPSIIIKSSDEWSPGGSVTIPSSDSIIPVGTTPVYSWVIDSVPPGSSHTAGETIGSESTLTFAADAPGFYHITLRIAKSDDPDAYTEADTHIQFGIKTERPRVHISKEYALSHIRGANISEPPWTRIQYVIALKGWSFTYEDIFSYFLLWQATGDATWCQKAWDLSIKPVLYVNGDPAQGFQSLFNRFGGDLHEAAFIGGQYLGNFPIALDWGFDCLDTTQKDAIVAWVHQETEAMQANGFFETYLRNDGVIILASVSKAFSAFYGYDPNVNRLAELYIKGWQKLKRAWSRTGKGGSSGEGNGYGHSTANYLIHGAHAIWSATGEDVFEELDFFKQKLMFDAFGLWPRTFGNPEDPYKTEPYGFPMWEMSAIGGDSRRSLSWITIIVRPVGQALLTRYKDTEEGRAFMYLVRPVPAEWDIHEIVFPVVRDPNPPVPTKLSHLAEGMGYAYIRSDWTKDATWFAFWAGPHVDLHQHLDQGSFNIYKRRDLAIKSGTYDYASATTDHSIAYYTRTISANGILIVDPQEQFMHFIGGKGCMTKGSYTANSPMNNGICPPNDGGQRTCSPLAMSLGTVDDWEDNFYIYNTAKVTGFYDFEGVVSINSDITNAYNNPQYTTTWNNPKVTEVFRKTLYIRDLDIFLIGDVITATNGTFQKKTLLHALQTIEIDTDANTVIENERKGIDRYRNVKSGKIIMDDSEPSNPGQITYDLRWGNSTLLFETAFPEKFTYRLVGGRTVADGSYADFWVDDYSKDFWGGIQNRDSRNYPVQGAPENSYNTFIPTYSGGYGRYRLEVEAEPGQATDFFLNIYRPTVDGVNNEIPAYTKIDDGQYFGVIFNVNGVEYKAKFPKNGDAPFVGDAPPTIPVAAGPSPKPAGPSQTSGPAGKPTISAASSVVVSSVLGLALLFAL